MKAEIQKIRDVAVNGNAQFLVAVYPYASQLGRPASELLPQRDLELFFDSLDISFIDLIDVYATAETSMYIDNLLHLNAYGAEHVALALAVEVISVDSK
jgi:hypothetical protein